MLLSHFTACSRSVALHRPVCASKTQSTRRMLVSRLAAGDCDKALPPELQDLRISDCGQHLIDEKTGQVINECGATRFDVAVRALRGEFDPPEYMENTERASGLIMDCLTNFPAIYDFQLVVKPAAAQQAHQQEGQDANSSSSSSTESPPSSSNSGPAVQSPQELLERYRQLVAETCAADIPLEQCSMKERLGGKYLSLTIPARVQAAYVIDMVLKRLADDPSVVLKF